MPESPLGVGIVGASPRANWATKMHIPAVQAVPELRVAAVCTTRQKSAQESADRFGIPLAFSNPRRMAEDPDVDIVTIAVRPEFHAELAHVAFKAGKHVFCEWPLTPTSMEGKEIGDLARSLGLQNVVGLQGRCSPVLNRARDLIADGFVGEVMSCTVNAPRSEIGGRTRSAGRRYTLDKTSGSGIVATAGGHTLDAITQCLGEFHSISATTSINFKEVSLIETGETVIATSPDQVALSGNLESGALVSAHIYSGKRNGLQFQMDISGTDGDLRIISGGDGADPRGDAGVQKDKLNLLGARGRGKNLEAIEVPSSYCRVQTIAQAHPLFNLVQLYSQMEADIRSGIQTTPDFDLGERRVRLLETIFRSSDNGRRELVTGARD